jgi:hypothetical protein
MRGAGDLLENCAFIERNQLLPMWLEDDCHQPDQLDAGAGRHPLLDSVAEAGLLGQHVPTEPNLNLPMKIDRFERLISILDRWESEFDRASLYELKNVVAHGGLEGGSETDAIVGFSSSRLWTSRFATRWSTSSLTGARSKGLSSTLRFRSPFCAAGTN